MNGKEIVKALQQQGWQVARIRGSHHMMQKDGRTVPVPVHGARDIGIGLLRKIEKQTGVNLR